MMAAQQNSMNLKNHDMDLSAIPNAPILPDLADAIDYIELMRIEAKLRFEIKYDLRRG